MKYGSIITMADRGMDWRYYDSEFRKSNHKALSVPWGELDNMNCITGEEHALVRDDSYRDVPQILSL